MALSGAVISALVSALMYKLESIPLQVLVAFVGRFGMWIFIGYLLYSEWRWGMTLALVALLSPLDWRTIYRAREKKLDKLNTQNLPPINFDLK